LPAQPASDFPRKVDRVVHAADDLSGFHQERFTGPRARNHALGPVQRFHLQLFFELPQLLAQCGLRDVAAYGRASEMQFFGEHAEAGRRREGEA